MGEGTETVLKGGLYHDDRSPLYSLSFSRSRSLLSIRIAVATKASNVAGGSSGAKASLIGSDSALKKRDFRGSSPPFLLAC